MVGTQSKQLIKTGRKTVHLTLDDDSIRWRSSKAERLIGIEEGQVRFLSPALAPLLRQERDDSVRAWAETNPRHSRYRGGWVRAPRRRQRDMRVWPNGKATDFQSVSRVFDSPRPL